MSTYREYLRRNRDRIEKAQAAPRDDASQKAEAGDPPPDNVAEPADSSFSGPLWTTSDSVEKKVQWRRKIDSLGWWRKKNSISRFMARPVEREEHVETIDGEPCRAQAGDFVVAGHDSQQRVYLRVVKGSEFLAAHERCP